MLRHPDYDKEKSLQPREVPRSSGSLAKQSAGSPQSRRPVKKRRRSSILGILLFLLIGLSLLAGLFLSQDRLPGVKSLGKNFLAYLKAPFEQSDRTEMDGSRRALNLSAQSPAGKASPLNNESSWQQVASQKSGGTGLSRDFEPKTQSEP